MGLTEQAVFLTGKFLITLTKYLGSRWERDREGKERAMKRFIIPFLLVLAVGAGIFTTTGCLNRTKAPANTLLLSGNVEAHESVVGFRTARPDCGSAGGRRATGQLRRAACTPGRCRLSAAGSHRRGDAEDAGKRAGTCGGRQPPPRTFVRRSRQWPMPRPTSRLKRADLARYSKLYKRDAISAQKAMTSQRPPINARRRRTNGPSRISPKSAKELAKSRSQSAEPR